MPCSKYFDNISLYLKTSISDDTIIPWAGTQIAIYKADETYF